MSTLKEVPQVGNLLATVLTAAPLTHGALAVVPLLAPSLDDPDWLTLEEAGDRAAVTEVSEDGSVPFLKVANGSDRPLLLLDGEELVGAKQNRVLNTTVLVAARAEATIPVSCVEHGRWTYRSRRFQPGNASLYASVRAMKAAQVSRSVREGHGHRADQVEVWARLSQRAADLKVESMSEAMHDVYASHEEDLIAARVVLAARPGQVGAVVYMAGRWVGLELLAGPRLFARAWPRLSAGYVADAIGWQGKPRRRLSADTILARVAQGQAEPAPAVAMGAEYRLAGPRLAGGALLAQRRVAHLMAFPVS
jgi:hypothetical protein